MTNEALTGAQIVRALADRLPDDLLASLFPHHKLADIRAVLRGDRDIALPAAHLEPPEKSPPTPPPAPDHLLGCRLFTDGASRGNPGEAGAGAVIVDEHGEERAACSAYLGVCTNNVAEYKALLLGLAEARRLGCTEIAIAMDSELIVRQLKGQYKVKHAALLPLYQQVRDHLSRFGHWSVAHIPRAENARADQLANRGIDMKDDSRPRFP